ncbi:MAG: adenine-specific DNA methylase [Candidatus Tokpelaia sp.]|nr:MAG: adenine-specific DNA methylase [Candidatus Tokpelaia sp.]
MLLPPPPENGQAPVILDFFAGSGTTAQAVMELNAEDGGNRRYILCQLDEPVKTGSEAERAGYQTIDQIARERIKRAAARLKDKSGLPADACPFGFRHYYIKPLPAQTIDKITEFDPDKPALIAEDMVAEFAAPSGFGGAKGEEVLLATWAVADSYKLTDKIERLDIAGYQAHYAGSSRLYLIAPGWGAEQTKALLNRIGTYQLNVTTLILYGYSFTFESLRELENNVRQSLDKAVQIIKRY